MTPYCLACSALSTYLNCAICDSTTNNRILSGIACVCNNSLNYYEDSSFNPVCKLCATN